MTEPSVVPSHSDVRRNGVVYERAAAKLGNIFADKAITFAGLSEDFPDDKVPFLDRSVVDEAALTPLQRQWRDEGYIVIPGMISADLIAEYQELRKSLALGKAHFDTFTPYIEHDVIRRISLSSAMHKVLYEVLGQDMGLHFILTAYHSTERGWHQDDYLNPDYVFSNYCAAWISLGDIDPDAGPFEFIAGSHKWPCVRRHLVQQYLAEEYSNLTDATGGKGHWAEFAETFTNEAYVQEIVREKCQVSQFLGRPGDVLIWHGKLVHRGSAPNNPALERPAMISHFSGTKIRSDIGTDIRRYGEDGCHYWYFERKKG
jgi:hypothetical protein